MAKIIYKGQELVSTNTNYDGLAGKPFINGTELLSGDNSLRDLNIVWNGTKVEYDKIENINPNTIYIIQEETTLPVVIDGTMKPVKGGSGLNLNEYGIMNHETSIIPSGSPKGGNNKKLVAISWNDTGHITSLAEVDMPLFVGATAVSTGESGVVPPPHLAETNSFLCSNGGWKKVITAGTADPTGGEDGDIYFQYTE